jgi:hypothetical protein
MVHCNKDRGRRVTTDCAHDQRRPRKGIRAFRESIAQVSMQVIRGGESDRFFLDQDNLARGHGEPFHTRPGYTEAATQRVVTPNPGLKGLAQGISLDRPLEFKGRTHPRVAGQSGQLRGMGGPQMQLLVVGQRI